MLKTPAQVIEAAKGRTNCISPEKAAALMAKLNNALLIDVREPTEAAQGSLKGAINIPRGVLEMRIGEFCSVANTPIFIHCAAGGRAALSAAALQDMGYENLYVIAARFDEISQCLHTES